jgi:hypothetical protein
MSNQPALRDAELYSGLTTGLVNAVSPESQASRADARVRRDKSMQELQRVKAMKPTEADLATAADTQTLQLQAAQQQANQAVNGLVKQSSMEAFRRYDGDNFDTRHINVMLNDTKKAGKQLYGNLARVDKISEVDRKLIEQAGLNPELLINDPEMAGSYVKATAADGTTSIRSVDYLKAVSGYTDYASAEELTRQTRAKQLESLAMAGGGSTEIERTAYNLTIGSGLKSGTPEFAAKLGQEKERLTRLGGRRSGPRDNAAEREARRVIELAGFTQGSPEYEAQFQTEYERIVGRKTTAGTEGEREAERATQEAIDDGDARPYEEIYNEQFDNITTRKARTSGQKELEAATGAQDQLDKLAGGDFFAEEADFTSPRVRARMETHISAIEQGMDAKLSEADKKSLRTINELTRLGGEAGQLTDEQTGLIDRVFRSVSKYVSNNVEGVAAEAAYAGYRNTIRHALFGSVLTAGEQKSFVEQFGSLGQQAGPILVQLRSSLEQVRSNYETLVATNNPYVVQYRTGKTSDELFDVMEAIDERIDMIDNFKNSNTAVTQPAQGRVAPTLDPAYRAKMDAIYNKGS